MKWTAVLAIAALFALAAPVAAQPVELASVSISVSCNTNPERATLHNYRSSSLTIYSVGSTYLPRSGEPYTVNKHLAAHASITYQSGTHATSHVLTHQFIYNNDHRDGVRFKTSAGIFVKHC